MPSFLLLTLFAVAARSLRRDGPSPMVMQTATARATTFTVQATDTGELRIGAAGSPLALTVQSSFNSSAGRAGFGHGGDLRWNVSTQRVSDSVWTISGVLKDPSGQPLLRIDRTATVEARRVAFADTVHVGDTVPSGVLGLDITHAVQITGSPVINATVPGAMYPYHCTSLNEQEASVDPDGPRLHRGTQGNPSVHVQTANGGVGLLPLDDVFEIHSYATQAAMAIPPGWPSSCTVTSPPSISLRDKYLALSSGTEHIIEWAVYPQAGHSSDYWSFINAVRQDVGADQVPILGSGYLSMYPAADHEPFLRQAGYLSTWEEMSTTDLRGLYDDQAMYHVHNTGPAAARSGVCKSGRLVCHGSCFVHELPDDQLASMHLLINKTKLVDPNKSVLLYAHSMISAETNASSKYADSIVTNSAGEQVHYVSCDEGSDYPLFFANSFNSYGSQMLAYYTKALEIGFTGIYHDEFCGSTSAYTYSAWDGVSGVLDPTSKKVLRKIGSLCLMTQHHEMQLAAIIRDAGGQMTFNGAPRTRSWRRFAQQSALLHEVENSEESRMMWLHLHTPIGLLRYGGSHHDVNPQYNATCSDDKIGPQLNMSACVGRNAADHLDLGVAPYLYDGLWPKGGGVNIMQKLFPLRAPITIGTGVLEAANKLYTKHSVHNYAPPVADGQNATLAVWVFSPDGILHDNFVAFGEASINLTNGHVAIIALANE